MSSDSPPRRRIQLHLSTCLVLMFVSAVLLFLNLRTRHEASAHTFHSAYVYEIEFFWGWPWSMNSVLKTAWMNMEPVIQRVEFEDMIERRDFSPFKDNQEQLKRLTERPAPYSGEWDPAGIVKNILSALAILFAVAYPLETVLRKRASSKPSPLKPQ